MIIFAGGRRYCRERDIISYIFIMYVRPSRLLFVDSVLFIKREFRSILIIICRRAAVKVSRPRTLPVMDGRDGTLMKARAFSSGGRRERARNAIILSLRCDLWQSHLRDINAVAWVYIN